MNTKKVITLLSLLTGSLLAACGPSQAELDATTTQMAKDIFSTQTAQAPTATETHTPSPTATVTPTPTSTSTSTSTPTPTLTPTPGLSTIGLTLEDLPAGFVAMPAEEVREMEEAYPEGASAFGFQDNRTSQVIMGVLIPYPSRAEQSIFDSMMPQFVQAMAAAVGAESNSEPLPGLEDTGETHSGITAVGKMGSFSMRWDIVVFRRSEVGVLVIIAYPDGDQPATPVVHLAQLLDERIRNFSTINPSLSTNAAADSRPDIFCNGMVRDAGKVDEKRSCIG